MDKQEKIKLLERLVKDGHITFCEAMKLMETEKEYIYTNGYTYPTIQPYYYGTTNPTYVGTTYTTA